MERFWLARATREEWEKAHPAKPIEPSPQDKLNASTNVQIAQLMQANKEQAKINAQLTLGLAQLKSAQTKEA